MRGIDTSRRIRSGVNGQATRQERTLCRASTARLAHSEIWKFEAETGEDPFAKVKGVFTDLFGRLQEEASTEARQKARCDEATVRCDRPWSPRVEGVLWPSSLWVESGSGSLATPRSAEPKRCWGAGRGSAGVRSNVLFPSAKKEVTHTYYTCSVSAHVQRVCVCVSGVCARAVWNKKKHPHR